MDLLRCWAWYVEIPFKQRSPSESKSQDTTANTISFAIAMLAGHPKVQDWLSEEINAVMGDEEHPNYEETYPKLVRCLALMVSRQYP